MRGVGLGVAYRAEGGRCRIGRLPILVVYALVLCGSPFGRAGFLWVHQAVDHRESSVAADEVALEEREAPASELLPGAEGSPEGPGSAPSHFHRDEHVVGHSHPHDEIAHTHAANEPHAHGRGDSQPHYGAAHPPTANEPHEHSGGHSHTHDRTTQSRAANEPHDHGGFVHTHEESPSNGPTLLASTLSEFYLAPQPSMPAASAPDRPWLRAMSTAPAEVTLRVEIPPPRRSSGTPL